MTERDELLDALGQARPDLPEEQVSSHTPAAQALLEEILSMDTMQPPSIPQTPAAPGPARVPDRAGRRRRLVLAGAAVVLAAVAATTILTVDSGQQVGAASVRTAAAETSAILAESGRAELRYHEEWDGGRRQQNGTEVFEFSGDDVEIRSRPDDWHGVELVSRIVDGRRYGYPMPRDADVPLDVSGQPYEFEPEALLAALHDVASFETVGQDDVDGFPTQHLRATDPGEVDALARAFARDVTGALSSLDVWIDEDDLLRRIDMSMAIHNDDTDVTRTFSIRFFDFGAPITIEPGDYTDYTDTAP
jgi:hypothetical protein